MPQVREGRRGGPAQQKTAGSSPAVCLRVDVSLLCPKEPVSPFEPGARHERAAKARLHAILAGRDVEFVRQVLA